MNIIADAKYTVIVDGLRVGRLVREGATFSFYVPTDSGFSQRLLALNGITLPQTRQIQGARCPDPAAASVGEADDV